MGRSGIGIDRVFEGARLRGRLPPGLLLLLALAAPAALTACASTPLPPPVDPEVDLHNPDPGRRAMAVQKVAADKDEAYVPDLIELLDDRDESVRMLASAALVEVTGRESDYRPFADRADRLHERAAWRAWYAERGGGPGGRP